MSSKFKRSALGARVPHEKKTSGMATVAMPLPEKIVLPMQQHIGAPCTPTVKKGDAVLVGTVVGAAGGFVGAAIHSGVSGTVEAVETVHMPNGRSVPAVVIRADGEQTPDPACVPPEVTDHASLIAAVQACGLVGLGGAGFPTAVKLSPKDLSAIDTLVINGAECEPYITSDNREFLECSESVMRGIAAVKQHLGIKKVVIGIDGCGVPVFAYPMKNIATAYKNLACIDTIQDDVLQDAAHRFIPRIHEYPHMMRGTGYLCSLINHDANIIAKGGANSVYGIGLKKERIGISFKIKDGTEAVWPLIIREIFRQIGYYNADTDKMLVSLNNGVTVNDNDTPVGEVKTVFTLEKHF